MVGNRRTSGGWDSNPRPRDYEDSRPERFAARRDERWRSERGASNTSLLKGGEFKISNR
jgi:hypothetical protein